MADDDPTLNAGLVALCFFQGIWTSISKKPYSSVFPVYKAYKTVHFRSNSERHRMTFRWWTESVQLFLSQLEIFPQRVVEIDFVQHNVASSITAHSAKMKCLKWISNVPLKCPSSCFHLFIYLFIYQESFCDRSFCTKKITVMDAKNSKE